MARNLGSSNTNPKGTLATSYSNTPDTLWADTQAYYKELEERDAYDAEIERIIEEIRPGFLDNHTLTIHHYKGEWAVNLWRVEDGQLEEEVLIEVLKHTIEDAATHDPKHEGKCLDCRACWSKKVPNVDYSEH